MHVKNAGFDVGAWRVVPALSPVRALHVVEGTKLEIQRTFFTRNPQYPRKTAGYGVPVKRTDYRHW